MIIAILEQLWNMPKGIPRGVFTRVQLDVVRIKREQNKNTRTYEFIRNETDRYQEEKRSVLISQVAHSPFVIVYFAIIVECLCLTIVLLLYSRRLVRGRTVPIPTNDSELVRWQTLQWS